ncbi:tetratricopeptide repeat protein [Bacteroidota bacterium]
MKKIIILSLLSIILISNTISQEYYELEEMFLDADSWFFYEDYTEALPIFLRVLEADSLNNNVMYKIGYCYLHIPGQKEKSIAYLENAIKKTTLNYRKNTYLEKQAPVDALFYLGNAYLVNNKINEAIDAYSGFQNSISRSQKIANKDIYDTDYLKRQMDACRNALQFQYKPVNFVARNVGDKINSKFNEFNAIISGDESTMVFTAALQFYDGIFYSKKDSNGLWSYPMNLMGQLGVDDNSATTGLSYDGTELYIYRDDDFDGNIYVSYLKDGLWTRVHKLGENINTKFWESHASLSPDNNKLYFVSNREGGIGDLDIYVSERLTDTTWGKPINLGKTINTRWNENTPFLTPDGKRLFFSSEGHTGMGGYDILYSEKDINGEWSEPVNIGYPINTTDDDIFFVPFKDGRFAYNSQFSKQGFGGQDIYQFQLFNIPEYNDILVEGVLELDNKVDRNQEDFSINIINKKTRDTIAVLKPTDDNLNYQYQTPLGVNHLLFETKFDENDIQLFISSPYDIKEVFLKPIDEASLTAMVDTMPKIILDTNQLFTDQENIKIKLSLQKGNKLYVNTYYKDKLINSEEFDIKKDDFIYEYKPLVGESKIKFKLIDKNNNVKTEEVTVSYLPKDSEAELSIAEKVFSLGANGKKNVKIKLSVERGSKLFVETFVDNQLINTETFDIKKESFIYEFEPKGEKSKLNFKLVDKNNNVKNEEVIISHTPISKDFADVLTEISSFNSEEFNAIISSNEVKSSNSIESLINQIYTKAAEIGLSKEQTQTLIIALAINSTNNTPQFIADLFKLANGDLKEVLDSISINNNNFRSNIEVIQFLESISETNDYSNQDIVELLETYLYNSEMSIPTFLANLEEIIKTDFKNVLSNINATAIDIVTLNDFKNYLLSTDKYTEAELQHIFSIMEGILIASKASKEIETQVKELPIAAKDTDKEKNLWMILYISMAGILLGLIIIYFNRRQNKANKKNKL